MHPLRIYSFGHFRVRRNGEPLDLGRRSPRRLLQLLQAIAVFGPRVAGHTRIVAALWPDAEGDAGEDAFGIAIHRLRKVLGDAEAVTVDGGRVGLASDRVWVDTEAFEAAADRIERTPERAMTQPADYARELCEALALYAGPLLAQEDEAWLLPARDRFERQFVRLAAGGARLLAQTGHPDVAMDILRRALDGAPLDEGLHRLLIGTCVAAGRTAEAVEAYRHCAKLLDAVLGVAPSPETVRALSSAAAPKQTEAPPAERLDGRNPI